MIRITSPIDTEEGFKAEVKLLDETCSFLETKLIAFAQEHQPVFIGRVHRDSETKGEAKVLGRYHDASGENTCWYYLHQDVQRYGYRNNPRSGAIRKGLYIFYSEEDLTEKALQELQYDIMVPGVQSLVEKLAAEEKVRGVWYCGEQIVLTNLKGNTTLFGYVSTEIDGETRYSARICGIPSDYEKTDSLMRNLVGKRLNRGGPSIPHTIDNQEGLK